MPGSMEAGLVKRLGRPDCSFPSILVKPLVLQDEAHQVQAEVAQHSEIRVPTHLYLVGQPL